MSSVANKGRKLDVLQQWSDSAAAASGSPDAMEGFTVGASWLGFCAHAKGVAGAARVAASTGDCVRSASCAIQCKTLGLYMRW